MHAGVWCPCACAHVCVRACMCMLVSVCVSVARCKEAFWKSLRGWDLLSRANRCCLVPWEGFPCSQAVARGVPLSRLPRYHDPPYPKP